MKNKILNCILYGGITKEEYSEIKTEIFSSNLKNTFFFSWVGFITYVILFFQASNSSVLSIMANIYKISAIYYLSLALVSTVFRKLKRNFRLSAYIGILGALVLGAVIGIFVNGNAQTTTFMVFMFAVPLLFTVRPVYASLIIFIADAVYIYLVITRQTGVIAAHNRSNGIIYGIMSILFSTYMMNIKIKGIANSKNYRFLMQNDQLTGLNNRRSFNTFLEKIKSEKINCTILGFDINGLKIINDTKGHKAGDELIIAAAMCISKTFSKYGKCFRIGGDEFVAILDKPVPSEKDLCLEFEKNCASWKSKNIDELSIAYGIVTYRSNLTKTIEEILLEVDALMYKNKNAFYSKKANLNKNYQLKTKS